MIANAGIAQVKPLLDLTEDDMQRMFSINVFGVHNCYAVAAKQMIKQGKMDKGIYKLIGCASIVAFKPFPLLSHYSASKWAVRGLTQAFAMEMADYGITVNAYAPGTFCVLFAASLMLWPWPVGFFLILSLPGIVGTAMWDLIDEKLGETKGVPKGEMMKKYVNELTALKRTSVPEDVSDTVHYLASKDSDFMTGQTLVIDGGIIFT